MADRILIVDDEEIIRDSLSFVLTKEGYQVFQAANGKLALDIARKEAVDIILTDLEMPVMKGIELLERVSEMSPETLVVIITAYGSIDTAIAALRKGAVDYILKPVEFDDLLAKIRRLIHQRRLTIENKLLRNQLNRKYDFGNIIGKSRAMQGVFEMIKKVATTDGTVLITGRSGTGKELVARGIHFNSKRADKPFIAVNCGSIVDNLFESELFGHKRGAFTGAIADREGFFRSADGGTIFLDEVSEIPSQLQVKLLRAIELKEIIPVGTSMALTTDIRIISATNKDLAAEVEAGRYREDLFYRLNVIEVNVPPLSERPDDIPLLVQHFVLKHAGEMNKDVKGVTNDVMKLLVNHTWKGEVRELQNVIERAVIFAQGDLITAQELPSLSGNEKGPTYMFDASKALKDAIADFEKQFISHMLRANDFNKEQTAKALSISLSSLYRKIEELGVTSQS